MHSAEADPHKEYFQGLVTNSTVVPTFNGDQFLLGLKVEYGEDLRTQSLWIPFTTVSFSEKIKLENSITTEIDSLKKFIGQIAVWSIAIVNDQLTPELILVLPWEEMNDVNRMILDAAELN